LSVEPHQRPSLFHPALAALFFGSGASALIYQVLWLRLLGLVFGVTVYAASTVWKLRTPGCAQGLRDLGTESFDRLLALFRAGPDDLRAFVGPGPLLTDDRPLVEYFLSLPRDRDVDLSSLKGDVGRYSVK